MKKHSTIIWHCDTQKRQAHIAILSYDVKKMINVSDWCLLSILMTYDPKLKGCLDLIACN